MENENAGLPSRRIISEGRGRYVIIDENKIYEFSFPLNSSLLDNFEIISYLKNEIALAIEKKKEEEVKEKSEKIVNIGSEE